MSLPEDDEDKHDEDEEDEDEGENIANYDHPGFDPAFLW